MTNNTQRKHCPVSCSPYQHSVERTPRAHTIKTEDKIYLTVQQRHTQLFPLSNKSINHEEVGGATYILHHIMVIGTNSHFCKKTGGDKN
jgi:hypothetical protein